MPGPGRDRPRVIPGTYTVKLTKGKNVYSHQVTVTADPRSAHTAADRRAQFDLTMNVYRLLEEMAFTVIRLTACGHRSRVMQRNSRRSIRSGRGGEPGRRRSTRSGNGSLQRRRVA